MPKLKSLPITGTMFYNLATMDLENRFPVDFLLQPRVQELILFFSEHTIQTFDRILSPCELCEHGAPRRPRIRRAPAEGIDAGELFEPNAGEVQK